MQKMFNFCNFKHILSQSFDESFQSSNSPKDSRKRSLYISQKFLKSRKKPRKPNGSSENSESPDPEANPNYTKER